MKIRDIFQEDIQRTIEEVIKVDQINEAVVYEELREYIPTAATTMATLRALQKQEPKELILAIPVGPPDTIKQLGQEADRVICLSTPRLFWAVGAFYGRL